ncbi:MAG: hypothetical protein ABI697_10965 [Devosia sp.]
MNLRNAKSREDLFDELKFDRAKPDEAEAEAARRGWAPLAPEPDVEKFNPLSEQHWSLSMAMAWIAMRSVEAVRDAWDRYRAEYPVWRRTEWRDGPGGEIRKGWLLEHLGPANSLGIELFALVGAYEEAGKPPMTSVTEAREALWSVLQEGLLPATGIARASGVRVPIPAVEWHALRPHYNEHRDEIGGARELVDYTAAHVPSTGVRHLWGRRREAHVLPPLVPPKGDGYVPLGCAAQWIATEGGSISFEPTDTSIWAPAFEQLLGAVASEKVRVVGMRAGAREIVPGFHFAGCRVDYPYADATIDLMMSEAVYLRCYPYVDEARWRDGFDDALISRHKDYWTQLMVEKGAVRERWPFVLEARGTGAAGRPTKSIFLIVDEFERRAASGQSLLTLREEATALLQWLKLTHPDRDRPVLKTIENNIRKPYRSLRAAPK